MVMIGVQPDGVVPERRAGPRRACCATTCSPSCTSSSSPTRRATPTSCCRPPPRSSRSTWSRRGATCTSGWNEPAIEPLRRVGQQQRAAPPARRGDGLHRAGAVRRRHDRAARRAAHESTSTSCARAGCRARAVPRRRPPVRRRRVPHGQSGKVELRQRARWPRMGQPALPTFVPPDRGPATVARGALPVRAADAEAAHPLPELAATRTCPSTARSRGAPVRRAVRRRRRAARPRRRPVRAGVQRPWHR